ncbi:MAG: type II secretion system minor pseudopilin GspJ [Thiotrichaceae bacterium]|nr:type II secretion system minor pseudopilin GspJ [Thiotrichaceae bacterium]
MMTQSKGFTLIELLVALTLLAIMATVAYSGLSAVIVSSDKIKKHQQLMADIQRTVLFFEKDVRQLSPRLRFTEHETYVPALEAIENNNILMTFSRGGVYSPRIMPRSTLQRVAYKLDDKEGSLIRLSWAYVDYLSQDDPVKMILINDIESVKIKFLNERGRWGNSWGSSLTGLPVAMDIEFKHKKLGVIRRLIPIYSDPEVSLKRR